MTLSPPQPCVPGQPYYLYFSFTDFESGVLTDPLGTTLDITYGSQAGTTPDVAGPFTYSGASASAPDTLWRISQGEYAFQWDVPSTGILPGVYVANWTSAYGPGDDLFLATENFPVIGGAPFTPVPTGDTGYWTGSLTYTPSWAPGPFAIPFGTTDALGITWLWQGIDGWDSPPSAGQVIQRSGDHGGWPAPQFYGPRIMTITAMASAPTQALRDQARALLQQAVPVGDLAVLEYDEPVPKQAMVRRNATSAVTETCPTLTDVVFTIPLVAPDPRKYEVTPQVIQVILPSPPASALALPFAGPVTFPGGTPPGSTAVTAVNAGNFETRPLITVSGPITSPAVVNAVTGQQVTFAGLSLVATDQLVLDTDNRQSSLNGVFYAADVSSAWWVLEPGSTQVYLAGQSTGGATLTVSFQSAWI